MQKTILFLIFIAASAFLLTGCDDTETSSDNDISVTVNYDAETYKATVNISSKEDISYIDCTDFIKFFYESNNEKIQIESAKSLHLDASSGYFLDNEMVYPIGLGCDNMICLNVAETEYRYKLLEYEYKGKRTLTEEEKENYSEYNYSDELPDSLSEYVSHPLTGEIFIEITYQKGCETNKTQTYNGTFVIE